jgi:hypothetical protein
MDEEDINECKASNKQIIDQKRPIFFLEVQSGALLVISSIG